MAGHGIGSVWRLGAVAGMWLLHMRNLLPLEKRKYCL